MNCSRRSSQAYDEYNFHLIYQKLLNFCVADMGGFYLDVIKDRQYTTQADSLPRRSCQTAMFHIVEAMARWMAPVLSFTADEIWGFMPGERSDSVFLETWYEGLFPQQQGPLDGEGWAQLIAVKTAVAKQLELMRKEGIIGSSLDAEVELYCDKKLLPTLQQLGDELRFALITSEASAAPMADASPQAMETELKGLKVAAWASEHAKCPRCWHHREDVGTDAGSPGICAGAVSTTWPARVRRDALPDRCDPVVWCRCRCLLATCATRTPFAPSVFVSPDCCQLRRKKYGNPAPRGGRRCHRLVS